MRTAIAILAFSTFGAAATPTKLDLQRAVEQIDRLHATAVEGGDMIDMYKKKAVSIGDKFYFEQARTVVQYFEDFFVFNGCERRYMAIELETGGKGTTGEIAEKGRQAIEGFILERAELIISLATVYQSDPGVPADFKSYYKKVSGQCQAVATRIGGLSVKSAEHKASTAP